ncbi:MAG TPA: DUF5134 domain-containing protein [Amycolatopsis sp.]|nr:DUF5134 domain-containing protein [Amycolatopsis sp.]
MHGAVGWLLTLVFAGLVWPCVSRLVRLDYVRLGRGVRNGDLVELLLVVAMVAMLSPVGGPIPAAGWQAILVLTTGWFAFAWWRGRRSGHESCGHHALSAAAMLYLITAAPHDGHGPWLNMSTMDTRLAWPAIAVVAAAYFAFDAAHAGVLTFRATPALSGEASRVFCRAVMGAGMGYMLLTAAL